MATQNEPAITVRIRLVTDAKKREQTLQTFRSLAGQVRGEPGCLGCHLLENVQEPGELTFVEQWRSRRELERYVRSSAFRLLMTGIDMASQEPKVEIQTVEGVRGLEYFEEMLAQQEQ
jgi:quinol monooxygenase YgiN